MRIAVCGGGEGEDLDVDVGVDVDVYTEMHMKTGSGLEHAGADASGVMLQRATRLPQQKALVSIRAR